MADFPATPTVGQIYTLGDLSWRWNGSAWDSVGTSILSSTNTWTGSNSAFAPGVKNVIANSNFFDWAAGTSFSNPANGARTAPRWDVLWDGTGATRTISQQAFTVGAPEVDPGEYYVYDPRYFYRWAETVAGTGETYKLIQQAIPDAKMFAGHTVTASFWAKADTAGRLVSVYFDRSYGTGGSATDYGIGSSSNISLTTSWTRYSVQIAVPSLAGKTLGTGTTELRFNIKLPFNSTFTIDLWGVQLEYGSAVTPYQTATGSESLDVVFGGTSNSGSGSYLRGTSGGTLYWGSLGSGGSTFLATPSSANLASFVTDETGSGSLMFNTLPLLKSPREFWTVSATSATGTVNFDVSTQAVLYYTSNAGANFTLNFRGNSTTTLSSLLAVGEAVSIVFLNTNGATPYYANAFQIDGSAITPKWVNGSAPAAGNASSIDAYMISIVKTAATPTYTAFAQFVKYA